MKISLYLSMLFIILAWNCCLSLKVLRTQSAIAEVETILRKTLFEKKTGIRFFKSLAIWNEKKKFNFCKLSSKQAYYLCHVILRDPTYGIPLSEEKASDETCVERNFQFNDTEDLEEEPKNHKLKMYTCPMTADAHSYYLAPVDEETPALAVFRSKPVENYVDAKVTDINLETLVNLGNIDFEQIKKKIRKMYDFNKNVTPTNWQKIQR